MRPGRAWRRVPIAPLGLIASLAILVGACSAAVSSAPPSVSSAPSVAAETVTLSLTEYKIDPAAPTMKAGVVTIEAKNAGTISHALLLTGASVTAQAPDFSYQPGAAESFTVALAPGTYTFFCPVDGHAGLGMKGTLTVTP